MAPPKRRHISRGGSSHSGARTRSAPPAHSERPSPVKSSSSSGSRKSRRDLLEEQLPPIGSSPVLTGSTDEVVSAPALIASDSTSPLRLGGTPPSSLAPGERVEVSSASVTMTQTIETQLESVGTVTHPLDIVDASRTPPSMDRRSSADVVPQSRYTGDPAPQGSRLICGPQANTRARAEVLHPAGDEYSNRSSRLPRNAPVLVASGIPPVDDVTNDMPLDEFGLPVPSPLGRTTVRSSMESLISDNSETDIELQRRLDRLLHKEAPPVARPRTTVAVPSRGPPPPLTTETIGAGDTRPDPSKKLRELEKRQRALTRHTDCLIDELEDFLHAASGHTLCGDAKAEAGDLTKRISSTLLALSERDLNSDQDRILLLRKFRSTIKAKIIDASSKEIPTVSAPHDSHPSTHRQNSPQNELASKLARKQIEFELTMLADTRMPDVKQGADVDPDDLKDLLKVTVPDIRKSADRLRESIKFYVAQPGADAQFVLDAQSRCEIAIEWVSTVEDRCRIEQLYLDAKQPDKEPNFKPWRPNSSVSIYEFLRKFETWSRGTLSQAAQAHALYSKHLDQSVTQGCRELEERMDSYAAMREWLVQKWGRPAMVGDLYLSNIAKSRVPSKLDGVTPTIEHLKKLYSNLVTVSTLEVHKGKPVPGLEEYITTNRWLKEIYVALPSSLQKRFMYKLEDDDLELDDIEGSYFLQTIITMIKSTYKSLEAKARLPQKAQTNTKSSNPTPSATTQSSSKKTQKTTTHSTQVQQTGNPKQGNTPPVVAPPPVAPPAPVAPPTYVPSSQNNGQQRGFQPKPKHPSNSRFASMFAPPVCPNLAPPSAAGPFVKGPRWVCPLRNHQDHDIQLCTEFWTQASCMDRRSGMQPGACFTCLGYRQGCSGLVCANAASTPQDVLCQDCLNSARSTRVPPNVLLCGLPFHNKPSVQDITTRMEAWITQFYASRLSSPITINLSGPVYSSPVVDPTKAPSPGSSTTDPLSTHQATLEDPPNREVEMLFDTCTGSSRPVNHHKDKVIKSSDENVCYVMQLLSFKNEQVLTFYDSGANHNLVQAKLARDAGFFQLSAKPVVIGVAGGGELVTEHGQYMAVLGSCQDGLSYEIEAQAVEQITRCFPLVHLDPIVKEARAVIGPDTCFPSKIGGDEVKLLVGIRQTELAPRMILTLPSGVSVFESKVKDVFGSYLAFGGPHEVFTSAYRKLGINLQVGSLQVLFTEMASAYMESPWAFVRDEIKPPHEKDRLLEIRDSEPIAFTPAMVELAAEVEPELWFYDHESGDPRGIGDRLSELISEVAVDKTETQQTSAHNIVIAPDDINKKPDTETHLECHHADSCTVPHSCFKSLVPLSKLKGLVDEMDIGDIKDFRCDVCSNCTTCRMSARLKTKSLQEEFEQEVILKSVTLDPETEQVRVSLPFIKDPVKYLSEKHHGPDNKKQAMSVYRSQCMKSPVVKEQLRKTHKDLVDQGFMVPITDLPPEKQTLIHQAEFRHFYLWRAVFKESSASTPVRIVVDPTATGLNCILAKGTNMLGKIPTVLINFRSNTHAWCSDVSKMYNRLVLEDSALPYSLFLYHESLDVNVPPEIFVMTAAWYGVSSTGNQANVAVDRLWEVYGEEFPAAVTPLSRDRYMDDIDSGHSTRELVDEQVRQVQECLKKGGFATKFVAHSGEPPPEKATVDGESVGVLGAKWFTKDDLLGLNYAPMNIEKKVRGAKRKAKLDVTTPEGLREAFKLGLITRAGALGRVAEFYDPVGWFEPLKLNMKLLLSGLNGLDWKDPVPEEFVEPWVEHFTLMEAARDIRISRCIKPEGTSPDIRLLCISDASDKAGGCAIYGGYQLPDGSYSCSLLCSKSRLMRNTVPRNELEAILLCAETSMTVQHALQGKVKEVFYFSDSNIALCWVLNTQKKLRMWVHNRTKEIRNAIKWVSKGEETIPLFYIPSQQNIADLLTKPFALTTESVGPTSEWQTGLSWMRAPSDQLPSAQPLSIMNPEEIELYEQELFPEIYHAMVDDRDLLTSSDVTGPPAGCTDSSAALSHHVIVDGFKRSWLTRQVDFERLGWERSLRVTTNVIAFIEKLRHKLHQRKKIIREGCSFCTTQPEARLEWLTMRFLEKSASREAETNLGKAKLQQSYTFKDDTWFSHTRLEKDGEVEVKDIDATLFFDHVSIRKTLPIVMINSPLFKALLRFVHDRQMVHPGVEQSLKRIRETFAPMGGPSVRAVISSYRKNCPKCRRSVKKIVEQELADFPACRTSVAPPFYYAMIDIAMAFKARPHKDARKSLTAHALIVVCLVTSSTSIWVIDGLSTQAVVQALERHAARYGMPGELYVDPGTQLDKLRDASFNLRDVNLNTFQRMRFHVKTSAPKAHQSQGRVERRIRTIRDMLQRLSDTTSHCNTLLGWETVFARIASQIDDVPIARGTSTAPTDLGWEIITPNRLKLGRNNFRNLEGEVKIDYCPQSQLDRNRELLQEWHCIFMERVQLLVPTLAKTEGRKTQVGDIVLFVFSDAGAKKSYVWKLGKIEELVSNTTVLIRYSIAGLAPKTILRSIRSTVLILGAHELATTSL